MIISQSGRSVIVPFATFSQSKFLSDDVQSVNDERDDYITVRLFMPFSAALVSIIFKI
jgi:hypothetical protein